MTSTPADERDDYWDSPMSAASRRHLRAVFRYLCAHWPTSRKVKFSIQKLKGCDAEIWRFVGSRDLGIAVDSRCQLALAVNLLQHEYAHAVVWDVKEEHHGPAFSGTWGAIITAFEDGSVIDDVEAW